MQISIIIPIYKVEKYIERCINSVIIQTFTDYEVILVDDASPDNALQIAENLLQENNIAFQTIKHPENKGLSEARNSGIKVAQGNYLFFIDSDDDLPNKNVLQWFYDAIQKEDYDFVTARVNQFFKKDSQVMRRNYSPQHYLEVKTLENSEILEAWMWHFITNEAWNKLIKADFLRKHQLFFPVGYYYEDLPWVFDLYRKAKKACVLPQFTYNYYFQLNENAIMNSITEEKINHLGEHFHYILSEIEKDNLKNTLSQKTLVRLIMGNINMTLYNQKIIENEKLWKYAYKTFRKACRKNLLWKTKTQLFLPTSIAYFVIRKPIEDDFEQQNFFVKQFVKKLFPLNFQYEGELN